MYGGHCVDECPLAGVIVPIARSVHSLFCASIGLV